MSRQQAHMKKKAAEAALDFIQKYSIIGLGSGSTVNALIDVLSSSRHKLEGVVAASTATEARLKAARIPVVDLNYIGVLPLYIDGTDEVNAQLQLIKGKGGALTREKIIASASQQFICVADESKFVRLLGEKSIPIEVIPMGRSYVARRLVSLGAFPIYREGVVTDNGNVILDTQFLDCKDPLRLERLLTTIPGVVCNGLFAERPADTLLLATENEVKVLERKPLL
jgi:ribose 5-phosphate isomerase A